MAIKSFQTKNEGNGNIKYIHASIKVGEKKILIKDKKGEEDDIRVLKDELPEYPKLEQGTIIEDCSVIYDADNEVVLAINPYVGAFLAVGVGLGPRPDGDDSVPCAEEKEKKGNDGKPYSVLQFYEVFKILDKEEQGGVFYGTTPRWFLQDKFAKRPDGTVGISGTDASKWTVRLIKFGESQGLYDDDMEWPEDGNTLPALEERLLENETKVRLIFEDGFINGVLPVGKPIKVTKSVAELNDELGYKDDEKPAKKSAPVDELDVERDFPKDEPKKVKKVAKKVAADDDEDL